MARSRRGASVLIPIVALVLCSCGSSATAPGAHRQTSAKKAQAPRGAGVSATAAAVIEGWANALRDGHDKRAAAYWAHPSEMVNGVEQDGQLAVIRIDGDREAAIADSTLPCGAKLTATSRHGKYVVAEFSLSARKGDKAGSRGCEGAAAVDFLIRGKHIVRWLRAPTASESSKSSEGSEREAPAAGSDGTVVYRASLRPATRSGRA
jgi:hypothetical protein